MTGSAKRAVAVRAQKDLLARKALAYDTLQARLARVPRAHDDLHRITVRELRSLLALK